MKAILFVVALLGASSLASLAASHASQPTRHAATVNAQLSCGSACSVDCGSTCPGGCPLCGSSKEAARTTDHASN